MPYISDMTASLRSACSGKLFAAGRGGVRKGKDNNRKISPLTIPLKTSLFSALPW